MVFGHGVCFGRWKRFDRGAGVFWTTEKWNKEGLEFSFLYYWVLCIIGF